MSVCVGEGRDQFSVRERFRRKLAWHELPEASWACTNDKHISLSNSEPSLHISCPDPRGSRRPLPPSRAVHPMCGANGPIRSADRKACSMGPVVPRLTHAKLQQEPVAVSRD